MKPNFTDRPAMFPHKCVQCGANKKDGRKYIDWGLTIEFYGVVYLCSFCFAETMRLAGYVEKQYLVAEQAAAEAMRVEIDALYARIDELDGMVSTFKRAAATAISGTSSDPRIQITNQTPQAVTSGGKNRKEGTSKSNPKRRSESISDTPEQYGWEADS